MNYRYVAYTLDNKRLVRGNVSGVSEVAVSDLLLTQGYQPITLKPAARLPRIEDAFPSLFKAKDKDIIMFSRQLATLLDSGISIVPALQLVREEMSSRVLRKVTGDILQSLRAGNSFSEALSKHQKVFGELYCQLVAVGERTGEGADSIRRGAAYREKDAVTKKKIKKALTYPAIVLSVATIVIAVLVVFVLPKMTSMLVQMNVPLPVTTRMLIAFTSFVIGHILQIFLAAGVAAFAIVFFISRPSGRYQLDRLLLRMPVIGKANLMSEMARFGRTLALLTHVGLPLPETLELTRKTCGNRVLKEAMANVRTGLLKGEGLSEPMSRNKIFPRLLVQMVKVGEESGRLESTLETVASSYEVEADDRLSSLISMIEPVMTIVLALIVAFIALSVITPMYTITGAFS